MIYSPPVSHSGVSTVAYLITKPPGQKYHFRNDNLSSTPRAHLRHPPHTMPPRLPMLAGVCRAAPTPAPLISFLLPFLQARNASILASLSDNAGAYSKRIRRGRGPSSGHGKTSGRGHKGQKQHGKVPARFQGGQTPQYIAKGLKGFDNQYGPALLPRS